MSFCGHTGVSGALPEVEFRQQSSAEHEMENDHYQIKARV